MSIQNIHGTKTGRVSSKDVNKSNTPKSGKLPSRFQSNEDGELYCPEGCMGLHMGPRTKRSHPYTYDALLVYSTGEERDGSCYSDRLLRWRPVAEVRALMKKHFGDEGDYFDSRSPAAIQSFLRETLNLPELKLTRVEEHCNQSSGFPTWYFAFIRGTETTDSLATEA
jgi:hypothetical protein